MSIPITRRRFVTITPVAGAALLAACGKTETPAPPPAAPAAAPAAPPAEPAAAGPVAENDPQAIALGYVADASTVDKSKRLNFADGSSCSNCALYQGKAGDPSGPCPLFQGKAVAAKGWCNSWAKKA